MKYFEGKTVLITGATGLVGSCLVDKLMQMDNVHVIALSRSESKLKDIFNRYLGNCRFSICVQDVSLFLPQFNKPIDIIFHAASPIAGGVIKNNPVDVITPNIIGTKNFLDFLRTQEIRNGVKGRLVLFSSATVYSNITTDDKMVSEEDTAIADTLDATNAPYSESKRIVEVLAKAYYKQYDVDSVIARFSYIYGYSYFQPNTAFYEFLNKAISGNDIVLNNSDIARRDNIYVKDAVSALLCLCEKGKSAESYNISSNGELNNFMAVDEMASIIAKVVNKIKGSSINVNYLLPISDSRKPGVLLNNNKMKMLGWEIKTSVEKGIEETICQVVDKNI
ncbi:MAG: NAD(P)-dependent oxidoreductase [Lachnospiraceae bacterium]|nr:NAD(P)-dependent oxidoreductase [Lachnospiraceae bacterium]